jgi:erythromycin esterase-like protein
MKHLVRAAIFVAMVALFLFAWSLPAGASGKIASTNGQVAQAHIGLNASARPGSAPSADPRGTGTLKAISAVSANDMWAVGSGQGTLTEHWNGTKWSVVKSPNPGSEFNDLNGVAAVTSNDVWAVGSYSDNPQVPDTNTLIEHWNGTKWSVVSSLSPGPYSNTLSAVVAISASDVWAVGISSNGGGNLTLIEHWNGSTWSVVSSPSPNSNATLNGAVAISTNNVWAVGYTFGSGFSGGSQQTLIEQWNGSAWNVVSSPSPGSSNNLLNGVAAVSASDVWAVGFQQNSGGVQQTLIEQWNGSSWSVISSPSPSSFSNTLTNIAAVSASGVWAVGSQDNSGYLPQTLIEQWNGSSWSVVSSPNVGSYNNQLWGVVAFSPNLAWTVGFTVEPNGPPQTLVERWNGTKWSVFVSPNKIGAGSLSGVAAISASDIWAVGSDASGALTEHWNGTKWSFVSSPGQGTTHILSGVAALSSSNVWSVGEYVTSSNNFDTLTERWNGTKWSIVSSPNSASQFNDLLGVAAVSANNVWAVGNSGAGQQTLIEHWNGSAWSIVPSPSPGVNGNSLNAVVAVSANDVWAVGYQYNSSYIQQTLIEQWNGSAWSVVSSPSPGPSINDLMGITALSATNVLAVGYHDGNNTVQTLIEQWNGTQWSVVTSPNAVSGSFLYGVSAASANNVWAVGTYGQTFGIYYTLIEHWNGKTWSIVTSPNPGSVGSMLNGVVDLSGSNAWAVGSYSKNNFSSKTLTEHWNGSAWSVVTSPNVRTLP